MQNDDDKNRRVIGLPTFGEAIADATIRSILHVAVNTPERVVRGARTDPPPDFEKFSELYPADAANAWLIIEDEIRKSCQGMEDAQQSSMRQEILRSLMRATSPRLKTEDVFRRFCILQVHAICLSAICLRALNLELFD